MKERYETPKIEIIDFVLEESIAVSARGASFFEDIWGPKGE